MRTSKKLFLGLALTLIFMSCQEDVGLNSEQSTDMTFGYSGKEFKVQAITTSQGTEYKSDNTDIMDILKSSDLIVFSPSNKGENFFYLFTDKKSYETFLTARHGKSDGSLASGRTAAFSGYGAGLYLRMGDANAFDPNYNNYEEIDVINDGSPLIEYPYGGSISTPNEQTYWRGINNLYYYSPYFNDMASSIAVYNDTNYSMIVHINKDGNYGGWLFSKEMAPYSSWVVTNLKTVPGSNRNWDNTITSIIWKWY